MSKFLSMYSLFTVDLCGQLLSSSSFVYLLGTAGAVDCLMEFLLADSETSAKLLFLFYRQYLVHRTSSGYQFLMGRARNGLHDILHNFFMI